MDETMISVIIPVYNVEKYLEECLNTVQRQTFRQFEVLLIEDGSLDKSREICEEFCRKDERFKVFSDGHKGLSAARNSGLEKAKGKYVVFIDSDDRIENDMLEYLYRGICDYHTQVAICGIEVINGRKKRKIVENTPLVLTPEEALTEVCRDGKVKNHVVAQIYEKQLFDGIRFPEGRIFEDIAVYYRIIEKTEKIVLLDQIKYYYVRRKGSLSFGKNKAANVQRCYAYRGRYEYLSEKYPFLKEDMQRLIFINYRKLCKEWGKDPEGFTKPDIQVEKKFYEKLEKELRQNGKLTPVEQEEAAVLLRYHGDRDIKLWLLEGVRILQKIIKNLCGKGNMK